MLPRRGLAALLLFVSAGQGARRQEATCPSRFPKLDSSHITIIATGVVGYYTSGTIGAEGLGLISYYDNTNDDLKVVHLSNVLGTPFHRRR